MRKVSPMARRKLTTGERGWIGLVAYIVAVDSVAWVNQVRDRRKDETMSVAWGRWLQRPSSRILTGIAWATVSTHLFLSWPLPGEKTLKCVVQKTFRKRRTISNKQFVVFPTRRNFIRKEITNEL
jgi:hypothetical protein